MTPAVATPATPAEATPRIIAPAPYQVSFGRISTVLPAGTVRLVVVVNGKRIAARKAHAGRDSFQVRLPSKDSIVRIVAVDRSGDERPSARVGPVYGLPRPARRDAPAPASTPPCSRASSACCAPTPDRRPRTSTTCAPATAPPGTPGRAFPPGRR